MREISLLDSADGVGGEQAVNMITQNMNFLPKPIFVSYEEDKEERKKK